MILNGTTYDDKTPKQVAEILENCRLNRKRIRIHYGCKKTGRDWLEEWDVSGTIGRSTGSSKIPLMIANSRSTGGPGILDHCIVKIKSNNQILYQHPKYKAPQFKLVIKEEFIKSEDLKNEIHVKNKGEWQLHAQFRTARAAERWITRMS